MADGFRFDTKDMRDNIDRLEIAFYLTMKSYGVTKASQLQGHMQTHRPWVDRSGEAKRRLRAESKFSKTSLKINLMQGVIYGIWLEKANNGNYAIVTPTIRLMGPQVMQELSGLFDRLKSKV